MRTPTTADTTRAILAEMLTENTGTHILDSGGAYGRHWERNAGKSVSDFEAEAPIVADKYGITLSVFHYLSARLEYLPDIQAEFEAFAKAMPDDGWLSVAEAFAGRDANTWNTYNGECLLSQTLQGVTFTRDEKVITLIQVHGGCDVRGGYTKPRAFTPTVDMAECFPYDHADYELSCPTDHLTHSLSCRASSLVSWDGSSISDSEHPTWSESASAFICSGCGSALIPHAPEPC